MLSELNYYLDYPIKYLFLNTKGKALIKSTDYLQAYHYYYEIIAAKKIYNHFKKKNFGLGFFASFIPGTKAFTARQEYFLILLEAQEEIERSLNSKKRKFHIWHYSVISPFIFLNNFILKYYTITERALENIQINRGKVRSYLRESIPFLADMFSSSTMKKWLKKLAHSLINPIRIISQTLTFFHRILDAFFESSAEIGEKTSIPRQILKGLLALYFIPVRLMVGLIEESINFCLNILKYLLGRVPKVLTKAKY